MVLRAVPVVVLEQLLLVVLVAYLRVGLGLQDKDLAVAAVTMVDPLQAVLVLVVVAVLLVPVVLVDMVTAALQAVAVLPLHMIFPEYLLNMLVAVGQVAVLLRRGLLMVVVAVAAVQGLVPLLAV
jgi:hypothetical protein